MEYPGDAFHTFDSVIHLAVNGTVTSLPVLILIPIPIKILNCVPKTNKAFTGLEQHGAWKITKWLFWGGVSL